MSKRIILFAAAVVALTTGAAWAHDGHVHRIMGTVMARDQRTIQVKTPGGETLSIAVNDKTVVARGKQKVTIAEVQKGNPRRGRHRQWRGPFDCPGDSGGRD